MKKLNKVNDEYKNYKDSNEISSKNINDYIQKLKETTSLVFHKFEFNNKIICKKIYKY